MSGYNIEYFIVDFAKRTRVNLDFINDHATKEGPYEVTQLIDSILGLVIVPFEKFKKKENAPTDEKSRIVYNTAYNRIISVISTCKEKNRYYNDYDKKNIDVVIDFINHLRNSVAHGSREGLHFLPVVEGADSKIEEIVFYDSNYEFKGKKENANEFCVKLKIDEIIELTEAISDLYISMEKIDGDRPDYDEELRLFNELMENGKKDKCVACILDTKN